MNTTPTVSRRHDLDALRASAMLLGIAFHIALSFALGFPWLVQDVSRNQSFLLFQFSTHGFRMQLFFLVSGFFTAMLWRKRGLKALLWHRVRRILLPCLLGLVTVVPAMQWASGLAIMSGLRKPREATGAQPTADTLWSAIRVGDIDRLNQQLSDPAAVNARHPEFNLSALTWASLSDQPAAVALLLEKGAEVNARNPDGNTALHAAAFLGRTGIVELLIAAGADVQARNPNGETALNSAQADWRATEFIAGLLRIRLQRAEVERGRVSIVARLRELGVPQAVAPAADTTGKSPSPRPLLGLLLWLLYNPVFVLIWFLWFLCWMVAGFAVYARLANGFGWTGPPKGLLLSPLALLWLVPLTMIPGWFMVSALDGFGPDLSMGIIPIPHIFLYYAVFFGFGVLYYDCDDATGRVGRSWRWSLPLGLCVVFPLGLEMSTGMFGFRDELLPQDLHRPASVGLQALYAWVMIFGFMGLFRSLLTRENKIVRYLSDSSYWLYLAHLPLVILLQVWVRDWPLPAVVKFLLIGTGLTAFLLLTYDKLVRYTWLGTLLNGPRTRPTKPARVPSSAQGEAG